jgi:hypothetical protein
MNALSGELKAKGYPVRIGAWVASSLRKQTGEKVGRMGWRLG